MNERLISSIQKIGKNKQLKIYICSKTIFCVKLVSKHFKVTRSVIYKKRIGGDYLAFQIFSSLYKRKLSNVSATVVF